MKRTLSLLLVFLLLLSAMSVGAVAPLPGDGVLTARGYSVASCEGTEDEYVYVVFNKDMKTPASDVKIAVVGNWSYSNFAYVSSDTVEVVSPRIWRFTNNAYLAAAVSGTDSFRDQVDLVSGFYARAGVTNLSLRLFGTVEAASGERIHMIEDVYDESKPATHCYPNRVHFDASGLNYATGYDLKWTSCDSVSSLTETVVNNYWPTYGDYNEYAAMRQTLENWFLSTYINGSSIPFSFTLGGVSSAQLLPSWTKSVAQSADQKGTYYTVTYTNPENTFKVWAEFTLFSDFPTLEWCTYAQNIGAATSSKLAGFMGMDVTFPLDSSSLTLHTTEGSLDIGGDDVNDFRLVTQPLSATPVTYMPEATDGRSSEHAFPFYDIVGQNNGLMVGIGWTGLWKATFSANGNTASLKSGMANLNTVLYAGETVRTPLYSITYFDGSAEYGHNVFRQTVLAHYTPDDGSEEVCKLPISVTTESYGEADIIADVTKWLDSLPIDAVWTDATWFGNTDQNSWTVETGNWWVNTARFPSGSLRKVSNFLHENDKKYIVWFEPERVAAGTDLKINHSDLLINVNLSGNYILNLASEAGYQWVYNYLVSAIAENGIDVYRQDFNSACLAQAWSYQDTANRTGMTEHRYVENMYRLYDGLREAFPGIMLDNCASGGKRIDLEMLKRMVILHRTDYTCVEYGRGEGQWNFEGIQYQHQNLSYWLPLHGSSIGYPVTFYHEPYYDIAGEASYMSRSLLSPGVSLGLQLGYAADNPNAKKLIGEMADLRGYFLGDYYSLLTPTYDFTSKQAFMYVREDLDEAMLLVYNRDAAATDPFFTLILKGLNPDTYYRVTDTDAPHITGHIVSGRELMEQGLRVEVGALDAKVYLLTPCSVSATVYHVGGDNRSLYLVFDQAMAAPTADTRVLFAATQGTGDNAYLGALIATDTVEAVTPNIWRMENTAWANAGNGANTMFNPTESGYWYQNWQKTDGRLLVIGSPRSADGKAYLTGSIEAYRDDTGASLGNGVGVRVERKTAASITALIAAHPLPAAEIPLTASLYQADDDSRSLYLVFNQAVAAPTSDNRILFTATQGSGESAYRGALIATDTVIAVSHNVWKLENKAWADDGNGANVMFDPGQNGYWYQNWQKTDGHLLITGEIVTVDGKHVLNGTKESFRDDTGSGLGSGFGIVIPRQTTTSAQALITANALPASTLPLTAAVYQPADDSRSLYVVFSKPVTALTSDNRVAFVATQNNGMADFAASLISTTKVEALSSTVWRLENTAWADGGNGANVMFDPSENGYWYQNWQKTDGRLLLTGTVTALDGSGTLYGEAEYYFDDLTLSCEKGIAIPYHTISSISQIILQD